MSAAGKDMNFYVQYKKKPKTAGNGKKVWLKAIPIAVTLIVCVAAGTVLVVRNMSLQAQLRLTIISQILLSSRLIPSLRTWPDRYP